MYNQNNPVYTMAQSSVLAATDFRRGVFVRSTAGFSLVEVTLAMGLVSFCLVAMLGVIPVGLEQERKSADQLVAAQVLAAVASDFRSGPGIEGTTVRYEIPTAGGGKDEFYVDGAFQRTSDADQAVHNVAVRMIGGNPGQPSDSRMHIFITKYLPGANSSSSQSVAQRVGLADAVVQRSLN